MPIRTVLGTIEPDQLGSTLVHEHVVTASAGVWSSYPELLGDQTLLLDVATEALAEAREGGVQTIVDLTTMDLGRNVRLVREVATRSGMQIIAATGAWRDIPRALYLRTPDEVAALFVREIQEGIDGTDIKAGIIKVASDQEGVTPQAEVILRAAARAARQTGVAISTHSYAPGRVGDRQVAILVDEGMDLEHVCIGHSNDSTDLDYLLGLARQGCYLGLDRYPGGATGGPDWEMRTHVVKQLLDAGVGDRLLLSHDWGVLFGHSTSDPRQGRRHNPDGYLFIKRRVLPRLRQLGVDQEQVRGLMRDNPARFLSSTA